MLLSLGRSDVELGRTCSVLDCMGHILHVGIGLSFGVFVDSGMGSTRPTRIQLRLTSPGPDSIDITAIIAYVLCARRQGSSLKHVEQQTCGRRFGTKFTSRNYQWLDSEHQWRVYLRRSSGLSQSWRFLQ